RLNPLVHRNASTLSRHAYRTTLCRAEHLIADHVVGGENVLPGVAYFEMARAALSHALGHGAQAAPLHLSDMIWTAPLVVSDAAEVEIEIDAPDNGRICYRISRIPADGTPRIHHQGVAL